MLLIESDYAVTDFPLYWEVTAGLPFISFLSDFGTNGKALKDGTGKN